MTPAVTTTNRVADPTIPCGHIRVRIDYPSGRITERCVPIWAWLIVSGCNPNGLHNRLRAYPATVVRATMTADERRRLELAADAGNLDGFRREAYRQTRER